jgi:hypothetical protein
MEGGGEAGGRGGSNVCPYTPTLILDRVSQNVFISYFQCINASDKR